MTYTLTDDPADPCAYCVQWVESDDPDDVWQEQAVPVLPAGPVDRMYRFVHATCDAAVTAYSKSVQDEETTWPVGEWR